MWPGFLEIYEYNQRAGLRRSDCQLRLTENSASSGDEESRAMDTEQAYNSRVFFSHVAGITQLARDRTTAEVVSFLAGTGDSSTDCDHA
jgi:hypothetical protein